MHEDTKEIIKSSEYPVEDPIFDLKDEKDVVDEIEFKNHNKDWIKRFDEYQLSVIQGDKGDIIERTNYDECEMVYDTQTDNIVMKPYKHIIIKGSYDITQRWDRGCNTSITRRDVER